MDTLKMKEVEESKANEGLAPETSHENETDKVMINKDITAEVQLGIEGKLTTLRNSRGHH